MSLTPVNFTTIPAASGVQHSLSALSQSPTLQQRNYTVIDPTVPGNRLYETEDGEVALVPKTPGEIAGEKLLRPLLEKAHTLFNSSPVRTLTNAFTSGASFVRSACVRFDRAFSFPVAAASPVVDGTELTKVLTVMQDTFFKRVAPVMNDSIMSTTSLLEKIKGVVELQRTFALKSNALKMEEAMIAVKEWEKRFLVSCAEDSLAKMTVEEREICDQVKLKIEKSFDKVLPDLRDGLALGRKQPFLKSELQEVDAFLDKLRASRENELVLEPTLQSKLQQAPRDNLLEIGKLISKLREEVIIILENKKIYIGEILRIEQLYKGLKLEEARVSAKDLKEAISKLYSSLGSLQMSVEVSTEVDELFNALDLNLENISDKVLPDLMKATAFVFKKEVSEEELPAVLQEIEATLNKLKTHQKDRQSLESDLRSKMQKMEVMLKKLGVHPKDSL